MLQLLNIGIPVEKMIEQFFRLISETSSSRVSGISSRTDPTVKFGGKYFLNKTSFVNQQFGDRILECPEFSEINGLQRKASLWDQFSMIFCCCNVLLPWGYY